MKKLAPEDLANVPKELVERYAKILDEVKVNQIQFFNPYPKQKQFFESGAKHRERLFMAGNRLGKSMAGSYEVAYHLTGLYPDDWQGRRLDSPTVWWVAGEDGQSTRDTPQKLLLGTRQEPGTGTIPKHLIIESKTARGVPDLLDYAVVQHKAGKSYVYFKTYGKGRDRWQSADLDGVWFDEEPDIDVYLEGITRTNTKMGPIIVTFTPLKGMSDVVARFLAPALDDQGVKDRSVTTMTIEDVGHFSDEDKARIIASYPPHEKEARTKGVPLLGSGRVFPISEDLITEDQIQLPSHWQRIAGIDFGWNHPTACVWLAYDRDTDVIHVYDAYRQAEATPIVHAAAVRSRGDWIPVAWPHDGLASDKGSGESLADLYRAQGVNMTFQRACYDDIKKGSHVEPGIMEMLERMQTGRWKVARHLHEWFEEFRLYHRKNGDVVKIKDDLMAASRYAMMMLRFATTGQSRWGKYDKKISYPNLGIV